LDHAGISYAACGLTIATVKAFWQLFFAEFMPGIAVCFREHG
jgi:hypothetical protein